MPRLLKALSLFAVATALCVFIFYPADVASIALVVAFSTAIAELLAPRFEKHTFSVRTTSLAASALVYAVLATAIIAGPIYVDYLAIQITGPGAVYGESAFALIVLRILVTSFVTALTTVFIIRRRKAQKITPTTPLTESPGTEERAPGLFARGVFERGLITWTLVTLIALQVVLSSVYALSAWELVRMGDVGFLTFLLLALVVLLLAVGATLFVTKSRAPFAVFAVAAGLGLLVLRQWQPLLCVTAVILAVGACVYCLMQNRQRGTT